MSRIRTIKPEFWTDEKVVAVSRDARLLFIGIWNFADDAGNIEKSAVQLKGKVFPNDDGVDCMALVNELSAHGLVTEYSVTGKHFLHIPGFEKHQVINRPSKPRCPAYDDSLRTHGVLPYGSGSGSGSGSRKGREGEQASIPPTALQAEQQQQQHNGEPATRRRTKLELTELPEAWAVWAEQNHGTDFAVAGTTPAAQFALFADHHRAKGSVMAEWPAAWRTWCGRAKQFGPRVAPVSKQAALEAKNEATARAWSPPADDADAGGPP